MRGALRWCFLWLLTMYFAGEVKLFILIPLLSRSRIEKKSFQDPYFYQRVLNRISPHKHVMHIIKITLHGDIRKNIHCLHVFCYMSAVECPFRVTPFQTGLGV